LRCANQREGQQSGFIFWHLLALLSSLGQSDGNGLLPALHLAAFVAWAALGLALLVTPHFALYVAAGASRVFTRPLLFRFSCHVESSQKSTTTTVISKFRPSLSAHVSHPPFLSVGCPTLPKTICRTAPVGSDVEHQRESRAAFSRAKAAGTKIITACLHDNRLFHDCT
jgi:hypothetical protein